MKFEVLAPKTFNTATECTYTLSQLAGGPGICVKVADFITISSTLRAEGPRALLLLARRDIVVNGTIDVAGAGPSAPAGTQTCVAGNGINTLQGGSGGGGGSFSTPGSSGGLGNQGTGNIPGGGPSGTVSNPNVRAGCAGGFGSDATITGGRAGGAVYLMSGNDLTIGASGKIDATGAGGRGAAPVFGGGGGGSGGMIVLEARHLTTVMPGAGIDALGGAGGGGGGDMNPGGEGGVSIAPTLVALGGSAGTNGGGAGGDGSRPSDLASRAGSAGTKGGGGGGGGAGFIYIFGTASVPGGTVSPPPRQ